MGGRGLIERGTLNNFPALKKGGLYERGGLMDDLQQIHQTSLKIININIRICKIRLSHKSIRLEVKGWNSERILLVSFFHVLSSYCIELKSSLCQLLHKFHLLGFPYSHLILPFFSSCLLVCIVFYINKLSLWAQGGDLTFFKNLRSNSLPTGKSFQSNATKFPHPRLHIAVNPKAEPKKGTIKIYLYNLL